MYYTASRESLQGVFAKKRNNLSVIASHCHCPGCGTQRLLRCRLHPAGRCPNSSSLFPPPAAVVVVALARGGLGIPESFAFTRRPVLFARGSPTRGNGDDRRQRRKQGGAVGAAVSRMQATAQQTLGAATRPWRGACDETERLYEGQSDHAPHTQKSPPEWGGP